MAQYDIDLREYWRILKKRKLIVVLTAIILGIFSTAFAVFKAPTPIYTSTCSIKFEKETTVEGLYAKTLTWSSGDDIETQISMINSYSVFKRVAQRLGLIPKMAVPEDSHMKSNVIRIIDNLQSKVEVKRQNYTNILNIQVKDADPAFAQKLANTIASTYKDLHSENQMKRTTEAIKYIEEQLSSVRQTLKKAEEEFNRFSQDNQLLSIDLQSENLLARTQEIQNRIRELEETKTEIEALIGRLEGFIKRPLRSGQNFYSAKANAHYQATNDALVGLQLKRDSLLEDFTPQHPQVIAINRRVIENARKMKLLLQMQALDMGKRVTDSTNELMELDSKTNALMERKLEFDRLKRKVELYHDMTALLERKHQEALIKKAEKPEEITIVKPALLPTQPVNPPKMATTGAMGVMIGLVIGMLSAFVVETFDTSLGAIEDVEQTLKTQVLGVIPQADAKDIQESLREKFQQGVKGLSGLQSVDLISHFSPKSMIAESFRALRTNIQFKDTENKVKTIAVTSASPQEGKTLVSINLAITMAQAGVRTLLIGSDMRKPMIDRAFGIELGPGLSDILLGNYPWRDTVKTITDIIVGKMSLEEVMVTPGLDNLHIITSGSIPPNPAELIESKRLKEFVEEAEEDYDLIIFDSPPILSTADAAIMGSKVDGVLLVYRVGAVSRGLLKRSTAQLEQVKCNILGVILNGMKPDLSPDFQDFKYYKYYYSYGDREKGEGRRKRRSGFSLFGDKRVSPAKEERNFRLGLGDRGPRNRKSRRFSPLGSSLIVVALALLAGGILWQNGIIDPFKLSGSKEPAKKNPGKPLVKKKLQDKKIAASRKTKPKPEATRKEAIKGKAPEGDVKIAGPSSRPTAKDKVVALSTGSGELKGSLGREKAGTAAKISIAKSRPAEKDKVVAPRAATADTKSPVTKQKAGIAPVVRDDVVASTVKSFLTKDGAAAKKQETGDKVPDAKPQTTPPVTKKKAPIKTAALPSEAVSYPYSLYLGSFRTLERAKRAVATYAKMGLSPYWVKVDFAEKGIWFRIFTGHFRNPEDAERLAQEHGLKQATVKKTAYANLIGTYSRVRELEERTKKLSELGYSPYIIRERTGRSRLFVGAYVTEAGAKSQYQVLKSNGVESQVVER